MINSRFKIIKKLGEGRNKVFLCSDSFYDKQFAMKVIPKNADEEELEAFRKEFFILTNFTSNNIVKAYERNVVLEIDENEDNEFGIDLESKFIILEFIDGLPLLDYPKLSDEKVLREIIKQISATLYYLHQSNYIYYDLKPDNILIQEIDDKLTVKFIDFGFAVFYPKQKEMEVRGTAEYIAPEILKKEFIDYRCDLYSFGILLYRIIYNSFPFNTNDELDIYKSHIAKEFKFPKSKYSVGIEAAVKKLLQKDPSERFATSLEILFFLDIPLENSFVNEWVGAKCFSGKSNALTAIDMYLLSKDEGNILSLRGTEGSGKTTLLKQIEINADNVILLKNYPNTNNFNYWKVLVYQLFYNSVIYKSLNDNSISEVREFLMNEHEELIEKLRAILLKLTINGNIIVLVDDINLVDEFSLLVLKQLVQVMQVNNVKAVISEDSDNEYFSQKINNCQIYNLIPFSKDETDAFLETSFAAFFPKNQTLNLVLKYADLLPGSVISFIKDLITLEILEFTRSGPIITENTEKLSLLEEYQEEIFRFRLDKLEKDELTIVNILSLFETKFNRHEIQRIISIDEKKLEIIFRGLNEKNIIASENISSVPHFVSQSLKQFVYSQISDVKELHLSIGKSLSKYFKEMHSFEQGRQFELAGDFEKSFDCYFVEIEKAKKLSAYSYQRRILNTLAEMPISEKQKFIVNFELCNVLLTIDALKECLEKIDETSILVSNENNKTELDIIKGSCLIKIGRFDEGVKLLDKNLSKIKNGQRTNELKIEIASAEFDLGKYDHVNKIVMEVINNHDSSLETIGRGYTMLGLLEIYENSNLDNAIIEFTNALQVFSKANLVSRQAGIELNLGNIYDMIGDTANAEKHWDNAIELNLAVGNFEQEAYIQLNYGIYYFNKLDFEQSVKLYNRALNIFKTTGNLKGQGLVLSNLGEVYLSTCEYQLAIDSLEKAESIFLKTRNIEEEVHVVFLICKLYFILGLLEQLKSKFNSLENLISRNKIAPKHELYLKYHKLMLLILDSEKNVSTKNLVELRDAFDSLGEKGEYTFLTIQLAYQFCNSKLYSDAQKELMAESFEQVCKQNKLIFAEREFILGLIASENNDTGLLPSIEYYENAFRILENESITELTWKVTFKIAQYYFERGNLHKAKDYIIYSKSLLEYIGGGIKNLKIRNAYLSKNERSFVLETLEKFENKY